MTVTSGMSFITGIRRIFYRVHQVTFRLIAKIDESDLAPVRSLLPSKGQALFLEMSRGDQRHCLNVYHALLATGCTDDDLLAAALLHDSGKGSHRVRFLMRPVIVILHALSPRFLASLAGPGATASVAWWRRPFRDAWHHAELGAFLAEHAGLNPRVVLLIREHHDPQGPAAALHAVDEMN
jgi:HD domain